jgi:hypothetical protein
LSKQVQPIRSPSVLIFARYWALKSRSSKVPRYPIVERRIEGQTKLKPGFVAKAPTVVPNPMRIRYGRMKVPGSTGMEEWDWRYRSYSFKR